MGGVVAILLQLLGRRDLDGSVVGYALSGLVLSNDGLRCVWLSDLGQLDVGVLVEPVGASPGCSY